MENFADVLANLYQHLDEHDVRCGLWHVRNSSVYTRTALAYEQFGLWPRAQEMLFLAMNKRQLDEVCIYYADRLLYSLGDKFNLQNFKKSFTNQI